MITAAAALLAASLATPQVHIDFARLFPPRAVQEREVEDAIRRIERNRHDVAAAIEAYDAALPKVERLDAFLYLHYAIDTRDTQSLHDEEDLEARFDARTAFLREAIAKLDRVPAKRYAFFIEEMRRTSGKTNATVDRLAPEMSGWPSELYDLLGKQPAPSRELYAFTLSSLVRSRTTLAHLRGFPDAITEAYARSGVTREEVRRVLDAVANERATYEAFRRQHAAITAPSPLPSYTFDDARAVLHSALAPLGSEYVGELDRLLDPANGRVEIATGEAHKRGGFSKGFPGMTSVLYAGGFDGTYNAVRVVAHEGTHAVQRAMQAHAGARPVYASAPKFVMEALAMTAEIVLPIRLAEQSSEPALRRWFIDQMLASKGLAIPFRTAAEADLEERIYDGYARGAIHGAADLDALTVETFARYGIAAAPDEWTKIPLMYEDPFYDVNYTLASTVALSLVAQYRRDPARFAQTFEAAMRSDFHEPVTQWLRRVVGVDLDDPQLFAHALDTVRPYLHD